MKLLKIKNETLSKIDLILGRATFLMLFFYFSIEWAPTTYLKTSYSIKYNKIGFKLNGFLGHYAFLTLTNSLR
jgi:hypothetical protein